jgi:hypothetical protein
MHERKKIWFEHTQRIPTEWSQEQLYAISHHEEIMQESQEQDGLLFEGTTG